MCTETQSFLCEDQKCKVCFSRSFASQEHSECMEGGKAAARKVFRYNRSRCNFTCSTCSHTFSARITDITEGMWCGYCSGRKLCSDDDCEICLKKSFAT